MFTVSNVEITAKSPVAIKRPAAVSSATAVDATSGTYDAPRRIVATLRSSRSIPIAFKPQRANSTARGSPTYPRPTTPTRAWRDVRRSSKRAARSDRGSGGNTWSSFLRSPRSSNVRATRSLDTRAGDRVNVRKKLLSRGCGESAEFVDRQDELLGTKVATTAFASLIVTVQVVPETASHPLQPANVDPTAGS